MSKRLAADYLETVDPTIRLILAELAENSGRVARAWSMAVLSVRSNPERALEELVNAEIHLDNHIRIELADALRAVRAASNRLDRELPDDDEAVGTAS